MGLELYIVQQAKFYDNDGVGTCTSKIYVPRYNLKF